MVRVILYKRNHAFLVGTQRPNQYYSRFHILDKIFSFLDTEIGLGLDSENNNIQICITSGAAEIKKSRKRIFIFFLICPNLESAGLRNYLSKNSGLR